MNKLISSTLMTIVAVPFLMAAPAATKAQNGSTTAPATSTAKKTAKKHVKKVKATTAPAGRRQKVTQPGRARKSPARSSASPNLPAHNFCPSSNPIPSCLNSTCKCLTPLRIA